jgi:hypothetical protein
LDFSLISDMGPPPIAVGEACIVLGIALSFGAAGAILLRSAHSDEGENNYSIAQAPAGFKPWRRWAKVMLASLCLVAGGIFMSALVTVGVKIS